MGKPIKRTDNYRRMIVDMLDNGMTIEDVVAPMSDQDLRDNTEFLCDLCAERGVDMPARLDVCALEQERAEAAAEADRQRQEAARRLADAEFDRQVAIAEAEYNEREARKAAEAAAKAEKQKYAIDYSGCFVNHVDPSEAIDKWPTFSDQQRRAAAMVIFGHCVNLRDLANKCCMLRELGPAVEPVVALSYSTFRLTPNEANELIKCGVDLAVVISHSGSCKELAIWLAANDQLATARCVLDQMPPVKKLESLKDFVEAGLSIDVNAELQKLLTDRPTVEVSYEVNGKIKTRKEPYYLPYCGRYLRNGADPKLLIQLMTDDDIVTNYLNLRRAGLKFSQIVGAMTDAGTNAYFRELSDLAHSRADVGYLASRLTSSQLTNKLSRLLHAGADVHELLPRLTVDGIQRCRKLLLQFGATPEELWGAVNGRTDMAS